MSGKGADPFFHGRLALRTKNLGAPPGRAQEQFELVAAGLANILKNWHKNTFILKKKEKLFLSSHAIIIGCSYEIRYIFL